ncbi:MAG: hypothetical protein C4324_08170 [Blastocatellia bacterium]
MSFYEMAEQTVSPEVEKSLFETIEPQPGQIGFLTFIRNGFAGGDIFGSEELCKQQIPKLLRGIYLDLVDNCTSFPSIDSAKILAQLAAANFETFDTVGKGTELRFETDEVQGALKIADQQVSHLTILPKI